MASNLDRYRDPRYHARPPKARKIKPYNRRLRSGGQGMTLDPGQRRRGMGPKSIKPKLSIQVPKLRKK